MSTSEKKMEALYDSVRLPVISFGMCLNANKRPGCKSLQAVLGDDLCVECWDGALTRKSRSK